MTALVPEPVILRVVRLIERVEQGFETSDGWLLREIAHVHTEGRHRWNSTRSRGEFGIKLSADSSLHYDPVPVLLVKLPSAFV